MQFLYTCTYTQLVDCIALKPRAAIPTNVLLAPTTSISDCSVIDAVKYAIGQDVQWTDSQADPDRPQRPLCGTYKKHRLFIWQFVHQSFTSFIIRVVSAISIVV